VELGLVEGTYLDERIFFYFFCLSHVFVCLKVQRTRMQR